MKFRIPIVAFAAVIGFSAIGIPAVGATVTNGTAFIGGYVARDKAGVQQTYTKATATATLPGVDCTKTANVGTGIADLTSLGAFTSGGGFSVSWLVEACSNVVPSTLSTASDVGIFTISGSLLTAVNVEGEEQFPTPPIVGHNYTNLAVVSSTVAGGHTTWKTTFTLTDHTTASSQILVATCPVDVHCNIAHDAEVGIESSGNVGISSYSSSGGFIMFTDAEARASGTLDGLVSANWDSTANSLADVQHPSRVCGLVSAPFNQTTNAFNLTISRHDCLNH